MSMRLIAAAVLLLATPAFAHPASVEVQIGPKLRADAVKSLGVGDIDRLAAELSRQVKQELDRTGVLQGARLELTLVDAKPNRPTFKQLSNRPGLSMRSFGLGGAAIEGRAIAVDGTISPIHYQWYETDITQAPYTTTWSDANTAFDLFARRLARGDTQR